jgi:hypothetical protein
MSRYLIVFLCWCSHPVSTAMYDDNKCDKEIPKI